MGVGLRGGDKKVGVEVNKQNYGNRVSEAARRRTLSDSPPRDRGHWIYTSDNARSTQRS